MFKIYFHIKFHMPSFDSSLDITIKPQTMETFLMVTMLSHYTLLSPPTHHHTKSCISSKIYYHTLLQDHKLLSHKCVSKESSEDTYTHEDNIIKTM